MTRIPASHLRLGLAIAAVAVLPACASLGGVDWNIPAAGATWQVEQRNTGSYGRDITFQVTRGEAVWQGEKVVTLTNSVTGTQVMALPNGKWMAILGRDGKPLMTYDPPIGYVYPLAVGQSWHTRHKVTLASGSSTDIDYRCRVEAREQVSVPAGTFDTLKIVCESPVSRDVSWTIVDLGMHARQEFQRLAGHPQGAGTQQARLVSVKRP